MVVNPQRFLDVELAVAVEKAQQFPLFRVHADDRIGRSEERLFQTGDVLELRVVVLVFSHGDVLERLAVAHVV